MITFSEKIKICIDAFLYLIASLLNLVISVFGDLLYLLIMSPFVLGYYVIKNWEKMKNIFIKSLFALVGGYFLFVIIIGTIISFILCQIFKGFMFIISAFKYVSSLKIRIKWIVMTKLLTRS